MVPRAASLIAPMASSLIQLVASSLIDAMCGNGVTKAGKKYNNMDHMDKHF